MANLPRVWFYEIPQYASNEIPFSPESVRFYFWSLTNRILNNTMSSDFFFLLKILFVWLHWSSLLCSLFFTAMRGLLYLWWVGATLQLQCMGLWSCTLWALEWGVSSRGGRAQLPLGVWGLPRPAVVAAGPSCPSACGVFPDQRSWRPGPAAPRRVGSSQTRGQTAVPCTARCTPIHRTTREVPYLTSWADNKDRNNKFSKKIPPIKGNSVKNWWQLSYTFILNSFKHAVKLYIFLVYVSVSYEYFLQRNGNFKNDLTTS